MRDMIIQGLQKLTLLDYPAAGSVLCGVTEKFYGGEYHTGVCEIV